MSILCCCVPVLVGAKRSRDGEDAAQGPDPNKAQKTDATQQAPGAAGPSGAQPAAPTAPETEVAGSGSRGPSDSGAVAGVWRMPLGMQEQVYNLCRIYTHLALHMLALLHAPCEHSHNSLSTRLVLFP